MPAITTTPTSTTSTTVVTTTTIDPQLSIENEILTAFYPWEYKTKDLHLEIDSIYGEQTNIKLEVLNDG